MNLRTQLKLAALSFLDIFRLSKGRKLKSDAPVVLAPLIQRLALPEMPAPRDLMMLGISPEQFVTNVIEEKFSKGVVSRRVICKIRRHYGVGPIPGTLKSAANDPRFAEKRNRHSMLVLAAV